jgi:hypothetical protein
MDPSLIRGGSGETRRSLTLNHGRKDGPTQAVSFPRRGLLNDAMVSTFGISNLFWIWDFEFSERSPDRPNPTAVPAELGWPAEELAWDGRYWRTTLEDVPLDQLGQTDIVPHPL